MEFVQPIRNKETIECVKNELLKTGYRDYILFVLGINTGLRISDILKLKVISVKDNTHITIKEDKTGKEKRFLININLKQYIDKYIKAMSENEYLFQSRQGNNKALTRVQAYRIINQVAKKVGIKERIGTHTLRKTFGYHHYQQFKDIAILQNIFNHSSPSVTLRYIGINDDIKDKTIESFSL
ncbi:MAG: site-specific integrase [Cyanobacteriota bacterium]